MSDFIQRERERRQQGPYRVGTVVAVSDAEGLDVSVAGGVVTGVQYLDSYSAPGVGDKVALLYAPGQYFVLGKFGTTGLNLGPNLLPNPGFEQGVPGGLPAGWLVTWSPPAAQARWVDDETLAHSSGAAAQIPASLLATGEASRLDHDAIAVEPGSTYRVGGWFRGETADAATIARLTVVTAASADEATFFSTGTLFDVASAAVTASWVELAGTRTIPAGHTYIRFYPSVVANAGNTVPYVYIDDVSLRKQI